jgi:para-nitrobenzyl esterase
MPSARGLFHRAILQSGAAGLSPPTRADATALARNVIDELGTDVASLFDPAAVSAERLLAIQERVSQTRGIAAFTPCIDGVTVPHHPTDAVRAGDAPSVPLLLGSNRDEWSLFDVFFGDGATSPLIAVLRDRLGPVANAVHDAYRAQRADRDERGAWLDLIGDAAFRIPMIRLAEAQAGRAPVWMYRFDWATSAFGGRLGAAHAMELPFVWNAVDQPATQLLLGGDADGARALGSAIHGAWARFIRDGDPTRSDGLPPWPRYDAERRATMLLDRTSRVVDDPAGELRALWP